MPELPEVETIRLGLQKYLVGKKLERVELRLPKIVLVGDLQDLEGFTVLNVRRFGKLLVLDFGPSTRSARSGLSLVVHIKLTGQLVYVGPDRPKEIKVSSKIVGVLPGKFTHLILHFDVGKLFYNDIRQFGWIRVLPTESVESFRFIHELGPEPIRLAGARSGQAILTPEKFREILRGRKTKIKPLLLDQKLIGGVGNIYANDALFLAGIDPVRPAKDLSASEQSKLYGSLLEVLKRGLKYGGASEFTYVNVLGEEGEYQKHFLVYAQNGKPCKNCGDTIKKIFLGGRGTYFCQECQK